MSGNQTTRPNNVSNITADALVSPVLVSDITDFLLLETLDEYDPQYSVIEGFLLAACQYCIDYTNVELLERDWVYQADYYPSRRRGFGGIDKIPSLNAWWVKFPIWPVVSVESVTANGEEVVADDYELDIASKPARIEFSYGTEIIIQYKAGHATVDEINPRIILAIKMLASYLYERRGACDINDAGVKSGANGMLDQAKLRIGGL